jgi:hypothetical protein
MTTMAVPMMGHLSHRCTFAGVTPGRVPRRVIIGAIIVVREPEHHPVGKGWVIGKGMHANAQRATRMPGPGSPHEPIRTECTSAMRDSTRICLIAQPGCSAIAERIKIKFTDMHPPA